MSGFFGKLLSGKSASKEVVPVSSTAVTRTAGSELSNDDFAGFVNRLEAWFRDEDETLAFQVDTPDAEEAEFYSIKRTEMANAKKTLMQILSQSQPEDMREFIVVLSSSVYEDPNATNHQKEVWARIQDLVFFAVAGDMPF